MKRLLKKILTTTGYSVSRISNEKMNPTCEGRLAHMAKLGFKPTVIYDCGAFIGKWAKETRNTFNDSKFVLVEPNYDLYDQIEANTQSFVNDAVLIKGAVADKEGEVTLNIWENSNHKSKSTALAGSSLLEHVQGEASKKIVVPKRTIDSIVDETGLKPDLLKLDLQGAELPALIGAKKALSSAEAVIVEFGCLDAYENRTTPRQLMDFLYDNGFVLYDIVDLRYRPYDGALVGGDYFFVKKDSKLKEHKDYF